MENSNFMAYILFALRGVTERGYNQLIKKTTKCVGKKIKKKENLACGLGDWSEGVDWMREQNNHDNSKTNESAERGAIWQRERAIAGGKFSIENERV